MRTELLNNTSLSIRLISALKVGFLYSSTKNELDPFSVSSVKLPVSPDFGNIKSVLKEP